VPLRVLITRPEDQAHETAELVRAAGGTALLHPCLRLAPPADPGPLQAALHELTQFTWVAIASANAARLLAPALLACRQRPLLAAVGPRTAASLHEHGLAVELCASASTAEGLSAELLAALHTRGRDPRAERVLLPRAAEGREALAAGLLAAGVAVTVVTAYRMLPPAPEELAALVALLHEGALDLIPFGSPRTAEIALTALGATAAALLRRFSVGAIGATTAAALTARGVRVDARTGDAAPSTFAELLRALAASHRQRPTQQNSI
jgi:uroporphyrinogen-III synthase